MILFLFPKNTPPSGVMITFEIVSSACIYATLLVKVVPLRMVIDGEEASIVIPPFDRGVIALILSIQHSGSCLSK
jgi:hypothetical protein